MRRSQPVQLLASVALGALLIAGASPASAALPAGDPAVAADAAAPTVAVSGPFRVLSTESGSTVVWRPSTAPSFGDARLELAIDGEPVRASLRPLSDGTYSVSLPGISGLRAASLSVVAGGRVLDGAGATASASATRKSVLVKQPKATVKSDPGVKGKHKTTSFTYKAPGVKLGAFPVKTEVRAQVVLPKASAKGKRPLVVLLHGRHGTCYSPEGDESIDWPCQPGWKETPSFRGYKYVQKLLASQGFATVSISANGINSQDWDEGWGMAERAELIEHHLGLLKQWNAKGGKGKAKKLKGRIDLNNVVLVGYSRGGEGVNRASINLTGSKKATVRGQVLVAPTDFGRQVTPGVPTSVILPYCDGDVSDLEGQAYVDQGRYVSPNDKTHKSAVMLFGANHNYFNTEWTPNIAKAPASDDWWDGADATCGVAAKGRLTAKQQRDAGATYVAAAVRSFLTKDKDATRLLDGSPVRAKSAGKAVAMSSGFSGARTEVVSASSKIKVRGAGGMTAEACVSGFKDPVPACQDLAPESISPHWLTYENNAKSPWAQAVAVSWKKKGATARLIPAKVRNLKNARRLDLRVATAGKLTSQSFNVVLTDTKGRNLTLKPEQAPQVLPALGGIEQRIWAQTVRVNIPKKAKKFSLAKVKSISIKATSAKGELFFLDAFTSRAVQPKLRASAMNLPTFSVASKNFTVEETPSGMKEVEMTVTASNNAKKSSRVAISVTDFGSPIAEKIVTFPAGKKSITVPFKVPADGVYGTIYPRAVTVTPLRDAITTDYLGLAKFTGTVPVPQVTFPTTHVEVTQGESAIWEYKLSELYGDGLIVLSAVPTEPAEGLKELTAANVPASLFTVEGGEAPDGDVPLSSTWLSIFDVVDTLKTTGTLELPTRGMPKLTEPAHVQFTVFPDPELPGSMPGPVTLTATINPAP